MKPLIILLDYLRHDHTQRVKDVNLNNAGAEFDLIEVDMLGISKAINEGIKQSNGGHVVTMANDILMPNNWLKNWIHAAETIPNSGMIGIHTVEGLAARTEVNGLPIWEQCPFGNVLITNEAIEKVGYFNLALDPYSTNDADYYFRCIRAGLRCYYIEGKAEHIGHDVGEDSDYRRMKDAGLAEQRKHYDKIYLSYEQD